MADLPTT